MGGGGEEPSSARLRTLANIVPLFLILASFEIEASVSPPLQDREADRTFFVGLLCVFKKCKVLSIAPGPW